MSNSQDPIDLTRTLLDKTAELRHGFLDVLGESTSSPVPTFAQQAMNSPFVATVYERLWRPISFYLASGVTSRAEQRRAAAALHLSSAERLLDVACGPGNFTGPLARELPEESLAVGFDISAPMLTRAVLDNSGPRTCYVRGDAHTLPFPDETPSAVSGRCTWCPSRSGWPARWFRVLRPGGRIAILTSYSGQALPVRSVLTTGASMIGLTMFDGQSFVDLFTSAGLVGV